MVSTKILNYNNGKFDVEFYGDVNLTIQGIQLMAGEFYGLTIYHKDINFEDDTIIDILAELKRAKYIDYNDYNAFSLRRDLNTISKSYYGDINTVNKRHEIEEKINELLLDKYMDNKICSKLHCSVKGDCFSTVISLFNENDELIKTDEELNNYISGRR